MRFRNISAFLAFALILALRLSGQCTSPTCEPGTSLMGDLEFKTLLGSGSWPPSFEPFKPDVPCGFSTGPRGIRYREQRVKLDEKNVGYGGDFSWSHDSFVRYLDGGDFTWGERIEESGSGGSSVLVWGPPQNPPGQSSPPQSAIKNATQAASFGSETIYDSDGNPGVLTWRHSWALSSPLRIKLDAPIDVPTLFPASAYKHADGRYQTCDITGYVRSCPGKYEYILVYSERCIAGGPETERQMPPEEFEISAEDADDPRGTKIETSLPTTEDTTTTFIRLEYRHKPEPFPAGTGGESSGASGSGGSSGSRSATELGRLSDGSSAGRVSSDYKTVTEDSFRPSSQSYDEPASSEVSAIRDASGALRQIRTPDILVDITPLEVGGQDAGYEMAFYPPAQFSSVVDATAGLYLPAGSLAPVLTVTYENPDAPAVSNANATRLRITRQAAGVAAKVTTLENASGGGIAFSQGDGLLKVVTTTTVTGSDSTERIERFSPAIASVPDSVRTTTTRTFSFGQRVVEESRGTGAATIFTTFNYDDVSTSSTYGLLLSRVDSSGAWERYEYDAEQKIFRTWRPLGDAGPAETGASLLRCTEIRRANLSSSSYGAGQLYTVVEFAGGAEVARSHRFTRAEAQTVAPGGYSLVTRHEISVRASRSGDGVAWDDSGNQFTHVFKQVGGEHDGEAVLEIAPDGGATFTLRQNFLPADIATGLPDRKLLELWQGTPNSVLSATFLPSDIVAGTRTRTITALSGELLSVETRDVASETSGVRFSGLLLEATVYEDHDSYARPQTVVHPDGAEETREYSPCCGQLTKSVLRGITTAYGYDALGRREWEKVEAGSGASLQTLSYVRFTYDSEGRVLTRTRVPTSGPEQLLERNVYDNAGTLVSSASPGSLLTDASLTRITGHGSSYDSGTGRTTVTVTRPGGATEITVTNRAVRLLSRTGTAVAPVRYEYGTAALADAAQWGLSTSDPLPYTQEIKLDAAGADTAEIVTTYSDFLGRVIKTVYGDGAASRSFYDLSGRLVRQTDPDGVQTLYAYEAATATTGQRTVTALDYNRNGAIDYTGTDRVTRVTDDISTRVAGSTYTVRRSAMEVWETDNSATATTVSISETTPDDLRAWETSYGVTTARVTSFNPSTGERTDTITQPDGTSQIRVSVNGRLVSETNKTSAATIITQITYGYDAHGRLSTRTLVGVGATTTTYYADDRPYTVTTPDPDGTRNGLGYDAQATTYAYDATGRVETVTLPDATQTFTTYWPTGAVKRTWGSRTYPSEYGYDAQGRVKTLTTWQNFATEIGAAITTWNYSSTRGWLLNKRYTDNTGPDYGYWPSGRLKTRDWARSVSGVRLRASYVYNNAGDLASIDYADATPDVANTYDRLGRLKTTTDAAGSLTRTYQNGRLDDETYAAGSAHLSGFSVARTQGTYNRPATLGGTSLASVTYGYDNAGRLSTLTQGTRVATLSYKPQEGSLQGAAIAVSGTARASFTRTTDALGRISRVDTNAGATLQARRDYTYNSANQRTEVVHEDALRWAYGYDPLGQVSSAQKRDAASLALPGYDHSFVYDTIGNRVSTTTNGRLATYAPDLRNQYVSRTVPAAFDVLGSAATDVNVVVSGESATRSGALFYKSVTAPNTSGPVLAAVTILAARPGSPDQVATETRSTFVAQTPEAFTYDLDGNLTQDGRWTYVWDAENRLTEMSTRADVAQASSLPRQKLVFAYDAQGRRVRKQVYAWNAGGGAWAATPSSDLRFLYDGWNLLAEYNALSANAVVRTHVWGLDLSGSTQGAGGVGGLLWTTTSTTAYAPGWDANGNIVAWIDLANGTVSGRRDYGASGEPLVATGNAGSLPFAFSTKYRDGETELYYYGLRYYNPSTGRWVNRDPIGERGGTNLYGMVRNDPVGWIDFIGLYTVTPSTTDLSITVQLENCEIVVISGHGHKTVRNVVVPPVDPGCGAAAGQDTCQNTTTQNGIPASVKIKGFPDNPGDRESTDRAKNNQHFDAVKRAIWKLCGCCKEVKYTVFWIPEDGWNGEVNNGRRREQTRTINCKNWRALEYDQNNDISW